MILIIFSVDRGINQKRTENCSMQGIILKLVLEL